MAGELDTFVANALGGGQVNPLLVGALQAGVGRTDLSPLLSNVGLGAVTGGIDPLYLEQAMKEEVRRLEREYLQSRVQEESKIEADVGQAPDLEQYVITARPLLADVVSVNDSPEWKASVEAAFTAIAQGQMTADQAGNMLYNKFPEIVNPQPPAGVPANAVTSAVPMMIDNVFGLAEQGAADYRKAETDWAGRRYKADVLLQGLGEAQPFDKEKAMRQFYSDAGVPALAYMSSPSATYQPDVAAVAKAGGKQDIEAFRTQMQKLLPEASQTSPYSFGAEQQSAASRARQLQQEHIKRVIAKEESKRKENANKIGQALAILGVSPYQNELSTMRQFAIGEALA